MRLFVLFFLLAIGSADAATPCYGAKEKQLANELLINLPMLSHKLKQEKDKAWFLRHETCGTIAAVGQLVDIDYAYHFFSDTGWNPIVLAAKTRHLDPLRVQAAMVDIRWPPKKI